MHFKIHSSKIIVFAVLGFSDNKYASCKVYDCEDVVLVTGICHASPASTNRLNTVNEVCA